MGSGIDIIILAMVAVFLVARLYKVLGRRTGHEQHRDPFAGVANDDQRRDTVVPLPERSGPGRGEDSVVTPTTSAPASSTGDAAGSLQAGIGKIRSVDPQFDSASFLAGARAAFEMIISSFAKGDTATLRPLLNDEVYENFANAIKSRQRAGETLETTLVAITAADLIEADLQGRNAVVTAKIVSDQINVTRSADGQVVEGDPSTVASVTDIWTFARNTRARDPNWTLIATRSSN
ncbi:MAG: Tim44/TimA family putative adaptor protein [Dongiaceae bacterium]